MSSNLRGDEKPAKGSSSKDRFNNPDVGPRQDVDDETTRRAAISVMPARGIMSPPMAEMQDTTPQAKSYIAPEEEGVPFQWGLKEAPILSDLYWLERDAVFVPYANAAEISNRISKVLYERSIAAVYDSEKAKVKCVSEDDVDFRIFLYRGRGDFQHGIIVEVQRRSGASSNFQNDVSAILNAAEGNKVVVPPPNKIPLPPMDVSDSEDDEPRDGKPALKMVWTMLKHPSYDSMHLGLQTLTSLTDKNKMGARTAEKVSTELLRNTTEVGGKIYALVVDRPRGISDEDDYDYGKLRTMALCILANAMHSAVVKMPTDAKEAIRPVLIYELKNAKNNLRNAFQAARCVEALLSSTDEMKEDFHIALESALEAGRLQHAALERQAQKCIDLIRSA